MKKIIYIALLCFVVGDGIFSFYQFYNTPLDGDMAESVLPMVHMEPLFEDPFALGVFSDPTPYHNPNRYFSHRIFHDLYNNIPNWLQNVTDPINSIYLTTAIVKFTVHILLIFFISYLVVGKGNLWSFNHVLSLAIITPLFQSNGYTGYMGVIDSSPSYVFFYGLPSLFVLIYFTPWILKWKEKQTLKLTWLQGLSLAIFAFVVALSGPLNAGIVGVVTVLFLAHFAYRFWIQKGNDSEVRLSLVKNFHQSRFNFLFLLPIALLSIYSLYVGSFNSYTLGSQIPLKTMYGKLPYGFFYIFTQKLAWPLFSFAILGNMLIIYRQFKNDKGKQIIHAFLWILAFCVMYISLLPLGGYRSYRPFIIRYDTIMPITVLMMFIFGWSSIYILNQWKGRSRIYYASALFVILLTYTLADKAQFEKNDCEKAALVELAKSDQQDIFLTDACKVVSWDLIKNDRQSKNLSDLLIRWNIISYPKQIRQ